MILKRYGTSWQSVTADFDARAMTEIGFRRDRETSIPVEEFDAGYVLIEERTLKAEASGDVQDEAEQAVLADLLSQLNAYAAELSDGEVLRVENDSTDYPKTRDEKRPVVVAGQNRLHFVWRIDPPLRVARYRRTS